jgi:putative NIF3 family GTP cyclohydrolase 1 type 2/GNAT superfamily N-acetyltransferase
MKAREIHEHLRARGTWVNWDRTSDIFQHGDPDTEVSRVAVGWMCTTRALRWAASWGAEMFITHEPMYYDHNGRDPALVEDPAYRHKIDAVDELGLAVYRCHDVWDRFPEQGVQASWDRGLGWQERPLHAWNDFLRVREIEPQPLREVAAYVVERLRPLGQKSVRIVGDPELLVARIGLGTGCTGGIRTFQWFREQGADTAIATEVNNWIDVPWADDAGLGLIVCNHSTSEQWAMQGLTAYLQEQFPAVEFRYVPPEVIYHEYVAGEPLRPAPPQLQMWRRHLADLPGLSPPEGYVVRTFQPGDEVGWRVVLNSTGSLGSWTEERVAKQLEQCGGPAHVFFVTHAGRPVATACVVRHDQEERTLWEVGWVGADPLHQGKGLGYQVVLAALHRIRELGGNEAYLLTDDWRLPAIKTYLNLGFEPDMDHESYSARWAEVRERLRDT